MSHVSHIVAESLVRVLDAAFLAGVVGSAFVLVLTFIEDLKTLFRP